MHQVRTFIVKNLWWMILIVAAVMLAAHSFGVHHVLIDNTSLYLLLLIIFSPFIAAVKKIKIGEFEAEIGPAEVRRAAEQAESVALQPSSRETPGPDEQAISETIRTLAKSDSVIALAKLRIELEGKLRRLLARTGQDLKSKGAPEPLNRVIIALGYREVLEQNLIEALRSVIAICNRAIHGEEIRNSDVDQMIDAGIDLIKVLDRKIHEIAATHPVKTVEITPEKIDEFHGAQYRLKTVVPLVENPRLNEYLLTFDELAMFLENYGDFAEFVVSLEMLSDEER